MMPTVNSLAIEFCKELRTIMSTEEITLAAMKNANQPDTRICHTHDYCDANMAMHAAFMRYNIDPAEEGEWKNCAELWHSAWELAKSSNFQLY